LRLFAIAVQRNELAVLSHSFDVYRLSLGED